MWEVSINSEPIEYNTQSDGSEQEPDANHDEEQLFAPMQEMLVDEIPRFLMKDRH